MTISMLIVCTLVVLNVDPTYIVRQNHIWVTLRLNWIRMVGYDIILGTTKGLLIGV